MKSFKYLVLLILLIPFLYSCSDNTTDTNKVATPVFSVASGTYTSAQSVSITCGTSGAEIRYTLNGSEPTSTSSLFVSGTPIIVASNTTIKAKAFKTDLTDSETATATYVIYDSMVSIPSGSFTMGRTVGNSGYDDELPTHAVTLTKSFYIGKYEVSQAEWVATMGSNPSQFSGNSNPVEKVSWYATLVYCNLRSIAEGLTPVYTISGSTNPTSWGTIPTSSSAAWNAVVCNWNANGYRLPSEAEWEYAARGGATSPDYLYSGSNTAADVAWYDSNSGNTTHAGGTKLYNGKGIYDMSGNVSEWVWDNYASNYYDSSPVNDPTGPTTGTYRVHRGGSWYHGTSQIRVAYRDWGTPDNSAPPTKVYTNRLGFRLVRTAE